MRLTYATLSCHPHWFLDTADFAPNGPALPRALCPSDECTAGDRSAEGNFGNLNRNEDGNGIRLRCPFCRKSLTGGAGEGKEVRVRWGRHVIEQHGVSVEAESQNGPTPNSNYPKATKEKACLREKGSEFEGERFTILVYRSKCG